MNTYVDKSPIHGLGLFAKRAIPSGSGIIIFEGDESNIRTSHLISLMGKNIEVDNDAKYVNHSTTPNSIIISNILIAAIDIAKDDEITFNYEIDIEN